MEKAQAKIVIGNPYIPFLCCWARNSRACIYSECANKTNINSNSLRKPSTAVFQISKAIILIDSFSCFTLNKREFKYFLMGWSVSVADIFGTRALLPLVAGLMISMLLLGKLYSIRKSAVSNSEHSAFISRCEGRGRLFPLLAYTG